MKNKEFILPEKWAVRSEGEETYVKYLQPYLEELNYTKPEWDNVDYIYQFSKNDVDFANQNLDPDYTLITFEEFKEHVLGIKDFEEDLNYLKDFLIKLGIT